MVVQADQSTFTFGYAWVNAVSVIMHDNTVGSQRKNSKTYDYK